jgi:hypothetical protein
MRRAVDEVGKSEDGIGLWYPSPSEYDSLAFLASLSESLANEIEKRFRLYGDRFGTSRAAALLSSRARQRRRLLRQAKVVRERARYTSTRREGSEFGAEGGHLGAGVRGRRSRERELVERPATLSSFISDFRTLAELANEECGQLVIAIDELDKMDRPEEVRALLRDIKGIFDVPGVFFLVSVSHEAVRSLNLGALDERNEFNSSFYAVFELPPATPEWCAGLLNRRGGVPREVALVLAVLAGGNPRELLRLAEAVGSVVTGGEAAVRAIREEALGFRREVVTAVNPPSSPELGENARVGLFNSLPDDAFDNTRNFHTFAQEALRAELWNPNWADDAWRMRFQEPWRRLLVRISVSDRLLDSESLIRKPETILLLRDVVIAAQQSAQVAQIVLERNITVEARAPVLPSGDARAVLTFIARRYEQIRQTMPSGKTRTTTMSRLVAEAATVIVDAQLQTADIESQLTSNMAGDRVIGFVAVQTLGDPATFETILARVKDPATPFEQYQALRALESLRPSLSKEAALLVINALDDPAFLDAIGSDTSRRNLAQRISKSLKSSRQSARASS